MIYEALIGGEEAAVKRSAPIDTQSSATAVPTRLGETKSGAGENLVGTGVSGQGVTLRRNQESLWLIHGKIKCA